MYVGLFTFLTFLLMLLGSASAGAEKITRLDTNQAYVEALGANGGIKLKEPKSVFAALLRTLPGRVRVYPTESYYYFSFFLDGIKYAGNIRLDIQARRQGKVYFTYFPAATAQYADGDGQRALFGKADGVDVRRLRPLEWQISYAGTSVVFVLNDLSGVKPPAGILAKNESFIGPVFDESGIRFFLVFDERRNDFLFILDETVAVADQFTPTEENKELLLGRRTAFVFYEDRAQAGRKVLVGVYGPHTQLNNYFDGPFDQLPDSFIVGDVLREAIIKRQPELKGKVDRFGNLADGERRVLIAPYATYEGPEDLGLIFQCIKRSGLPVTDECFPEPQDDSDDKLPR
jgi:hypothetical protein